MAMHVRQAPSISEVNDFRARESFDRSVESMLNKAGTATVNIGSIAAGGKATFTIPVAGAQKDKQHQVQVALPSTWNTDLEIGSAFVSNDGEVTVVVKNPTGGAIDPPSAVYGARVMP